MDTKPKATKLGPYALNQSLKAAALYEDAEQRARRHAERHVTDPHCAEFIAGLQLRDSSDHS